MQVQDIFEADVINFHKARDRLRPVPTTQGHVSFVSLRKGDPEWERAWQWLRKIEESTYRYDFDQIKGEQWQYMGTEYVTAAEAEHQKKDMILHVRDGITGEGYYHNFRTRWHPTMERRVYRLIPARRGWKPSYEDVLAGKKWMDSIGAAVQQMPTDHPELVEKPPIGESLHETKMPDRMWRLLGKPLTITLKDGRKGVLKVERNRREGLSVNVTVDGKYAGGLAIDPNDVPEPGDVDLYAEDRGSWSVSDVFVNHDYQRQGIATAMYNVLAKAGLKIMRSGVYGGSLKPDGRSLWQSQAQWKRGREVHPRFWKPKKTS